MKERVVRYDIIRIVAILMVLILHCSTKLVVASADSGLVFQSANILNGIGRAGVPLFLMLSGALLLDEKKTFDTKKFYKKSLLGITLLLLFWLLFYAAWRSFLLPQMGVNTGLPAPGFTEYLLKLPGFYPHLWYLFMLIGLYLAIPVLRLFVKKENKNYVLGFILVAALAQFITKTAGLLTLHADYTIADFMNKFHLEYATGYLPYLLLGWYLSQFPLKKSYRILLYLSGLAGVIFSIFAVSAYFPEIVNIHEYVMEPDTLPAMLYGAAVFTFLCELTKDRSTKNSIIRELSLSSFGVYIVHVAILDILTDSILPFSGSWIDLPVVYILCLFLITYGLSLAIVLPLSRVPGVKKIFHY